MQESALISYYYFGRSTFETKRCLILAALLYAYLFLAFNSAPIASLHIPVFFFSLICNTNWKFYTMKGASALDLVVTLMFSMTSHFWFVFLSQFYPYGLQAVSLDKCFVNVFLLSMSLFSQCLQYPTSLPKETFWCVKQTSNPFKPIFWSSSRQFRSFSQFLLDDFAIKQLMMFISSKLQSSIIFEYGPKHYFAIRVWYCQSRLISFLVMVRLLARCVSFVIILFTRETP